MYFFGQGLVCLRPSYADAHQPASKRNVNKIIQHMGIETHEQTGISKGHESRHNRQRGRHRCASNVQADIHANPSSTTPTSQLVPPRVPVQGLLALELQARTSFRFKTLLL